ncbi:MAG: 50S ribosomal protein L10 [Nanoarchaeota archaeon]|nr:50S ribosomal protein L10 [Nanoarchaeota archaeon]
MVKKAHVSEEKKQTVKDFVKLCKDYPIIGIVNMENLPAPQLTNMRAQLREKVLIRMTKKNIITIVINQVKADKPGIEKILEFNKGMPALLFTKENPFSLMRTLNRNKSSAPAKAGQIAPKDIIVPAGPTPFAPGPIISELSMAGIKAGIEGGKVAIKQDSTAARKGDVISAKTASLLTRLGINPMEVGLDLVAVYEDEIIYGKDVLSVDEIQFMSNLKLASSWAVNLAMKADYPTIDTIKLLVAKAFRESKAIGIAQCIMADQLIPDLLARADREASMLKEKSA